MRPSLPHLALPPLPKRSEWSKAFPFSACHTVNTRPGRGGNKRLMVADESLADEFAKSMRFEKGTHVLEAYPGPGILTRSLLKQPASTVANVTTLEPAPHFLANGLHLDPSKPYTRGVKILKVLSKLGHDWNNPADWQPTLGDISTFHQEREIRKHAGMKRKKGEIEVLMKQKGKGKGKSSVAGLEDVEGLQEGSALHPEPGLGTTEDLEVGLEDEDMSTSLPSELDEPDPDSMLAHSDSDDFDPLGGGSDGGGKTRESPLLDALKREAKRGASGGAGGRRPSADDYTTVYKVEDIPPGGINNPKQNDIFGPGGTESFYRYASNDDPRLQIVAHSAYEWATFAALEASGSFKDVEKKAWSDEPSQLHFVAMIPETTAGEQLVAQWISCIPERAWLFGMGRVKMSLLVRPALYDRLTAIPISKSFCKLSVMRAALCSYTPGSPKYIDQVPLSTTISFTQLRRVLGRKADAAPEIRTFTPTLEEGTSRDAAMKKRMTERAFAETGFKELYEQYPEFGPSPTVKGLKDEMMNRGGDASNNELYYPPKRYSAKRVHNELRDSRPGLMLLTLEPRKESVVTTKNKDVWDYVLRRLFVTQSIELSIAIKNLGIGAANLLPKLTDTSLPSSRRVDPKKLVRELNLQDWHNIVQAFQNWKFAPDILVLGATEEAEDQTNRAMGGGM